MARPISRDQAIMFVVGIPVILLFAALAYATVRLQFNNTMPWKHYSYTVAEFHDVGLLKARDPVKKSGLRVGEVESIAYRDGLALVKIRLDGRVALYRDARASIWNRSALGRKYIDLDPGHVASGPLANDTIEPTRNNDSVVLEDVLSPFDQNTRDAARSSLFELGTGLAGHEQDLHAMLGKAPRLVSGLGSVSAALASKDADLPGMLHSLDRLAGTFNGRQGELASLTGRLNQTFHALTVDGGAPLERTLRTLPSALRQAHAGLSAMDRPLADLRSTLDTVRPGAQDLGDATPDLRDALREGVDPLRLIPEVSGKATPSVDDLTATLHDLRPVVARLPKTVRAAATLLNGLAPYAPDAGRFFSEYDLLTGSVGPGKHYLSLFVTAPTGMANFGLPDPAVHREPYPQPGGGAWRHHGLGEGKK